MVGRQSRNEPPEKSVPAYNANAGAAIPAWRASVAGSSAELIARPHAGKPWTGAVALPKEEGKREPLEAQVDHIIEESRMVLPGIQALFGFQLIAVFSPNFSEALPATGRLLHLGALVLVACAIALIMAPAAYHRQVERHRVSNYFADYASRLITLAMAPLLVAISMEVALVSYAINPITWLAATLAVTLAIFYAVLWFAYPRLKRRGPSR